LTALHLQELGVPANRVVRLDAGEIRTLGGVEVRGVFALPTGADVLDTTGYLLRFANGRSVYHTSDTAFHPLVLAAPREPDVMLVPINGKWGNPGPEQRRSSRGGAARAFPITMTHGLNAENRRRFGFAGSVSRRARKRARRGPFV
jgi:L-ascorbate metabolism protein UlaG (beta-lactamase superfamily)